MPLTDLTTIELRDRIAAGDVRSVEAVEAAFAQIDRLEPTVGAFISLFRDEALQRAGEIDRRRAAGQPLGALAGVPVAVKDNMCTTTGATTCGSRILQNFHSPYEATAVRRLLDVDAVIIGKANMDEFAMGSSTENSGLQQRRSGSSGGGPVLFGRSRFRHGRLDPPAGQFLRRRRPQADLRPRLTIWLSCVRVES
jgi:aspartyl-tRNA(Asn)/glutamyl-tRNA(Gln) amidotransferase subunit A